MEQVSPYQFKEEQILVPYLIPTRSVTETLYKCYEDHTTSLPTSQNSPKLIKSTTNSACIHSSNIINQLSFYVNKIHIYVPVSQNFQEWRVCSLPQPSVPCSQSYLEDTTESPMLKCPKEIGLGHQALVKEPLLPLVWIVATHISQVFVAP